MQIAISKLRILLIGSLFSLWPMACMGQGVTTGQSFYDGFDNLDLNRWLISDGWVNGNWQNCEWSKDAVTVAGGILRLNFRAYESTKRDYQCGEIQSRAVFGHGVYEARIKTATGSGLNAAFFTYIGPPHGQPHDEIDFEVLTKNTNKVSLNTYVSGQPENGQAVDLPFPANQGFLTYSFIWDSSGVEWFVDGMALHKSLPGSPAPVTAQKIFASFWGSETFINWMGPFRDPGQDLSMEIDWIAFTALGESCRFPGSLLCALD